MKLRSYFLFMLLAILTTGAGGSTDLASHHGTEPYIEPDLLAAQTETVPIIVTAADSRLASAAVERAGGQVNSDLWLIDAVSTSLPAEQIASLAAEPGIVSIVRNKGVGPAGRPGWVTDRREKKTEHNLGTGVINTPPVFLPDGGYLSITGNGVFLFGNPDGSERVRLELDGQGFDNPPAIGTDGTVYVTQNGTQKLVYAINSDGTVRWSFTNNKPFASSPVLAADGALYVVDKKQHVIALDPESGSELWRYEIDPETAGSVTKNSVFGPDGTLYVVVNRSSNPDRLYALDLAAVDENKIKWAFVAEGGKPLDGSAQIGANGLIYLFSRAQRVYAINPADGSIAFTATTNSNIKAAPALAPDGSLYVGEQAGMLHGFNPDGSQRFAFQAPDGGEFMASPAVSGDGGTVYVSTKISSNSSTLYAVSSADGTELWHYEVPGRIEASPSIDSDGNIFLGTVSLDSGAELIGLNPDGRVTTFLRLDRNAPLSPIVNPAGQVMVRIGEHRLVFAGHMPEAWDGRQDVEPDEDKREWKLSNPIGIDVGTDVLHLQGLAGQGVTVAVLDSGIYFNTKVKNILGPELDTQFVGQVDFVGDGTCTNGGEQHPGYCFENHNNSFDLYGHGSHVAGIIWSRITDDATNTTMGIAPDANILSVRVLGEDGFGTYEDVIEGIQYAVTNKDTLGIRILNMSISAYATTPYFVDPMNRAVEAAWANGLVVIAAAGNEGPGSESITVPGNDPYVITVGGLDNNRTPGYWSDDILPSWSATGPTWDSFAKPDVLAPGRHIISFLYNNVQGSKPLARLVQAHPDYSSSTSLYRMHGTSMATAVASGVAALMLQGKSRFDARPGQISTDGFFKTGPDWRR